MGVVPGDWELRSQGAEAKVYETKFIGRPCMVKERIEKKYRLRELDRKLSHRRLIQEARCNIRCRKAGVDTPCIYLLDESNGRLFMEKIQGSSIKDFIYKEFADGKYSEKALKVAYEIGKTIAAMHDVDIVHGDLTTSNMMLRDLTSSKVTMIDFGLANSQPIPEDKAVDLYVMERAFNSTHVKSEVLVDEVLRAYKACSKTSDSIFQKLGVVRLRGRKRDMSG